MENILIDNVKPYTKITYLIGAGASAKALPLVKDSDKVEIIDGVSKIIKGGNYGITKELINLREILDIAGSNAEKLKSDFEQIKKLGEEASNFATIDTYFRYLLTKKDGESRAIVRKKNFEKYFLIRQFSKRLGEDDIPQDNRYRNFLASIIDIKTKKIPENVKILSWNYDCQFEIALAYNFFELQEGKFPRIYPFPKSSESVDQVYDLIHLNGVAGFSNLTEFTHFCNNFSSFEGFLSEFRDFDSRRDRKQISFSFERENLWELTGRLQSTLSETTHLVVIGYSFPYFNRFVDSLIFKLLIKEPGRLQKIYFQDPYLDGQSLYNQFNIDREKIEIVHIKETEQFYLPTEL